MDTVLTAEDTAVAAATTVLSGSGAPLAIAGGGSVSWLANGFLIPWPPLTNSKGRSLGRPSCEAKINHRTLVQTTGSEDRNGA